MFESERRRKLSRNIPPFFLPILFFAGVILVGALCLHQPFCNTGHEVSWIDAFFTATSAVCVTGLTVIDTGTSYTLLGQAIILLLIQIGGLGIMSFTGLAYFLWRSKVSLSDRVAIGQTLMHDPSFHLGKFLLRLVIWSMLIEAVGALLIFLQSPVFSPFSSLFHAVSAFCNAGFSLYETNLVRWQSDWGFNLILMVLIVLGGIGFSVIVEAEGVFRSMLCKSGQKTRNFSWYSKIILGTSAMLIIAGWAGIYLAEYIGYGRPAQLDDAILASLFQSVTSRTAGFNTMDIGQMTNVSLLIIIFLMFIGGARGSCAGGIKVTTFRTIVAFSKAQFKGEKQAVLGKFAIDRDTINSALTLFVFSCVIITLSVFILDITEGGSVPHELARGQFLDVLFEVVSAFCTVGLSTGLTAKLSLPGKCVIIILMFVGRLGPLVLIAAMQSLKREKYYLKADERLLIG
jgi:trk system potassium uptake protein TrkH